MCTKCAESVNFPHTCTVNSPARDSKIAECRYESFGELAFSVKYGH